MSRRKQSNPKPLKVDEGWIEGEDGGKQNEQKLPDEEQPDDESPGSSRNSTNVDNPSSSEDKAGECAENQVEPDHSPVIKSEKYIKVNCSKIKREPGGNGKEKLMGQSEIRVRSRTSDLGEFGEVEATSETEEGDDRRKSHREMDERSTTPEIPGSEINGNGSPNNIQSQILQGLPYLHLLPPSMRHDAARLLFMPPILPPELAAAAANALPGPSSNSSVDKNSSGDNTRSGPGYFCKPCNIKFSSARTLDAHQTYYCSFRRDLGKDGGIKDELDGDSKTELMTTSLMGSKKRDRESGDEDRELTADESMEISVEGRNFHESTDTMNPNKMAKTGKLYSCMYCSYSADKKVSLNRHMRMHSGPSLTSMPTSNSNDESGNASGTTTPNNINPCSNIGMNKNLPEGVNALERYCQDCDIQFSSIKTFRVHKQYYCRTRHVLKSQQSAAVASATGSPTSMSMKGQSSVELSSGITVTPVRKSSGSPVPSENSPASTPGMSSQPFVVLPTSPLIIVPYCYIQAASILPGNVLPSQNALVVLPNGSVQGLPFTSVPMPIPSPSPVSQNNTPGLVPFHSQSNFSGGSSVKNSNGIGTCSGAVHACSVSPTSQSHSVFNDPKDILRKISSASKSSSQNMDSVSNESGGSNNSGYKKNSTLDDTSHNNSNEAIQSENVGVPSSSSFKVKVTRARSQENLNKNLDGDSETGEVNDENMPAIDLTLRRVHSKKEISGDEEKENREVCLIRSGNHSQSEEVEFSHGGDANIGRKLSIGTSFSDFHHRDRELSSPSERLSIGSGSCGKRTSRPSSTSISSSCSTPPALCEPKVNGAISRLSPSVEHDLVGTVNNKNHSIMTSMMSPSVRGDLSSSSSMKKGSVDFTVFDMIKHKTSAASNNSGEPRVKRGKISHIATQLPGGAILTTSSNQSLTDLLMSNSSELNESLAKINPQLSINSRSTTGSPIGLNPVLLQALSQADPEIVMRMFDPLYLSNLQQTLQQHHHQQQQQQQATIKRGYSKCVECDIVFYKHENYLVHKEHYCAARISSSSSPNDNTGKSGERDSQPPSRNSGTKTDNAASSSRISSCSSPAKSDIDGEERVTPPMSLSHRKSGSNNTHHNSHPSIKLPRKSTDSSSSDFFPQPVYEKTKSSRSPQTISSSISVSPIPSPQKDGENSKEKQINVSGSQYPCVQCGVKYSTIDNLKAHQSFYCTKRRNKNEVNSVDGDDLGGIKIIDDSERDVSGNNPANCGNLLSSKGLLRCGKCKLAIPEDQVNSHSRVCLGSNGSVHHSTTGCSGGNLSLMTAVGEGRGVGWKCPCCDTYSPTVSAAQKHLEIHTGIKAFKCLLCGYRGNTLRGMRTHIRTHFDKRVSDLLEGEYMTCITANELEQNASTPVATNKSYTLAASDARTLDLNHRNEPSNRLGTERNKLNHSPPTNFVTTCSLDSPKELADVKVFGLAGSGSVSTENAAAEKLLENNNRLNYCNLCNYSSSYRSNIIRHMKLVHKISEESADKILTEMSLIKANSPTKSEDSNDITDHKLHSVSIKATNIKEAGGGVALLPSSENNSSRRKDVNGRGEDREKDETSESDTQERNCLPPPPPAGRSSSAEEELDGLSTLQKKEKPCAVKYCKSCDIYFNHLSTFDAHKKSYCSAGLNNKATERAETPVQ